MGQQGRITTVEAVTHALSVLGIDLNPLKKKSWDRTTALRVLKMATKSAFRCKALETHPDRNPGKADEFRRVSEARDLLNSLSPEELGLFLGNHVRNEKKAPKREMKTVSLTLVFHLPVVGRDWYYDKESSGIGYGSNGTGYLGWGGRDRFDK